MEIYQADVLIDGSGGEPRQNVEIFVENGIIQEVAPAGVRERPADTPVHASPGLTVLPGFIDVHVHLMFGSGPRTYDDVVTHDSDELMLLRAPRNAYLHLRAGVTTVRDCGARNRVTFDLRQGAEAGLFLTPRLQLCGRPLTITGGHFWWCNEEADGVEGVRAATRQLLKEGADFIKIMASGGGSTDSWFASYSVAELSAAVEEAHQVGKKTTAHCLAADSIARCRRGGHRPDRALQFSRTGRVTGLRRPRCGEDSGSRHLHEPDNPDQLPAIGAVGGARRRSHAAGTGITRRLSLQDRDQARLRAPFLRAGRADRDGYRRHPAVRRLRARSRAAPPRRSLSMDVILAATGRAAQAIGSEREVGMVRPGMHADFIYIDGDPLTDIRALGRVVSVVQAGRTVVDKRFDMGVATPALVDGSVHLAPAIH